MIVKPFVHGEVWTGQNPSVHFAYMRKPPAPIYGPHKLREWREFRDLTLEHVAAAIGPSLGGFTHASLSRIENRKQPYSQPILEALARVYGTDVASLLSRSPGDPGAVWSSWESERAKLPPPRVGQKTLKNRP